VSRCTRSQAKGVPARSLVQDSGAPAWLSTAAARDPIFAVVGDARSAIDRGQRGPEIAGAGVPEGSCWSGVQFSIACSR
jgi:hypothetical protein